jgi:acyl-CoA thioesterase-1
MAFRLFFFSILLLFVQCYHSKKEDIALLTLLSQNSSPIRVTIIGDSLSQWSDSFGLRQKLPSSYQITDVSIAGSDTILWLEDLSRAESIPTDIWILQIGTNDASYRGTSLFKERYSEILARLERRSYSFLLLSAVPKTNQEGLHDSILANNEVIRELVKTNARYRLVDLEKAFSNQPNLILYSVADPIHPNQVGYEIIGEEYRKTLLGL